MDHNYLKDINALKDDMMELKPTFLAGVPRVLERIHEGIKLRGFFGCFFTKSCMNKAVCMD